MQKRQLKRAKLRAKRQRASLSIRYGIYAVLRYVLVGFIVVSFTNLVFTYGFTTPKMNNIWRDNAELLQKYKILNEKIRSTNRVLDELKHRDNAVYRSLFGADTLSIGGIYIDYPDAKYADLDGERFSRQMIETSRNLDRTARRVYLQSRSLDQLQDLANDKGKMSTAMPALMPINPHDLRGHIGPFKMNRLHPVLGYVRPHVGIDINGWRGAPIYATGDGHVREAGWDGGYGNAVVVDHGFGYRTRYGHLSRITVATGQWVKRGEQIGEMGSTGLSTGTHLHYEVIYRGTHVDPMSYIQVNMNPTEFEKIVDKVNDDAIQDPWNGN